MSDRWQHHRLRDHFGYESDLFTVLSTRLGPWEEGTPLHYVIDDLLARMTALESTSHVVFFFTSNSIILGPGGVVTSSGTARGVFLGSAAIKKNQLSTLTADAFLNRGKTFTANAVLRGTGSFTANALLV